ncbi:MAG: tetratricopeptide repeat protein [Desulfatitalea sp.]|nr:tetratricopeptide repeat protein [Desulfatitalea sp.]NNK00971.1 tetratricopeptide repeat protein [Desulfatitalea sp.]
MKNGLKYFLQSAAAMLLLVLSTQSLQASLPYVYEERNEAEEKKQYAIQLEKDRQKCELAIINTKTLIGRSKNRPYLPELYLRLAELYIEKSRIVFFMRKSGYKEGEEARTLDQYEANMLKQRAIEIYQRILGDHPDFGQTDKVYFFLAHEYRELGKIEEMIKQYQTLIEKYPDSAYAPESYLLLGDYYFSQKQDVDKSKASYEAVLKYPQSPAVAAARYKLAWCQINLTDFKGAIALFEESVNSPLSKKALNIDTYRRVDVRLESIIDMAFCYPEVYKKKSPEHAIAYFRKYAWSRPVYATVLDKLAYRFFVKKKWNHSAALYRELAVLRQDPEKLAEYAKQIFQCVQAVGNYDHAEKDVGIIVRALEKQKYSVHVPDDEKNKMIADYELYARDIITHLHAEANKSRSIADFTIAADAYKMYLDFFKESPAHDEMAANYAEALFSSNQHIQAGKQYEKVAPEATVNNKQRQEMLYSAVISYYQALKNKDNLNYYQATYAREGLRTTGKTFSAEYPNSKFTPDVLFNVAWVSYDAGEFENAVADFSNFVSAYPKHKAAKAAVHLVMDAFNLMENYEGMINYGKSVLRANVGDAKLRAEVAGIVASAESKVVSNMTMAALDDWDNARQELMQVVDKGGKSAMGEQALHALVVSSKDKNDLATLYDAGPKLIQAFPESKHAKETLGLLVETSVKIGQYRMLSGYLEQYAKRYPKGGNASAFRLQAAQIQEGLGQYAEANRNYRHLLLSGGLKGGQLDSVVFSYADNAQQMGNVDAAIDVLNRNLNQLSPDGRLRAKALMGVLNLQMDRRAKAAKIGRDVKKDFTAKRGENDPILLDHVAQLAYGRTYHASGPYFGLKLTQKIDNAMVAKKAKMLEDLESGYQKVMAYKSPAWTLKACFRANELNREFADFLMNAPVPAELNAQERQQYQELIHQKARAYIDKADKYLQTCVQMAHKWEICDPKLSGYFLPANNPQGSDQGFSGPFAKKQCGQVVARSFDDPAISGAYQRLMAAPEDLTAHLSLAKAYLERSDHRQAALIAKNALSKADGSRRGIKAELFTIIGLSHLYDGNDPLAKEAFKKAMAVDRTSEARTHLAGLYRHYGHVEKAAELTGTALPAASGQKAVHTGTGATRNAYALQSE